MVGTEPPLLQFVCLVTWFLPRHFVFIFLEGGKQCGGVVGLESSDSAGIAYLLQLAELLFEFGDLFLHLDASDHVRRILPHSGRNLVLLSSQGFRESNSEGVEAGCGQRFFPLRPFLASPTIGSTHLLQLRHFQHLFRNGTASRTGHRRSTGGRARSWSRRAEEAEIHGHGACVCFVTL